MRPSDDVVRDLAPTGVLRATINLGNPVLAHGTHDDPGGVTVAIARELARRLDVPLELLCFHAAREAYAAMAGGEADLTFLAVDPAREAEVRFSPSYLAIEGVYVTQRGRGPASAGEVDRTGARVGVKEGSAYDLFLTRTLREAEVVRGTDGIDVYLAEHLDVGAGIRQPAVAFVAEHPTHRVLEPAFMQIRQAVGIPRDRTDAAARFVADTVGDLLASGFVPDALAEAGQDPGLAAAPPAP
ncbi:transporter substrate-binding domain-containing protein [Nocardioides sp. S-58]|uniref:Transporter substrate-binding domain-containing protein n=1 Tax=Nocardioides renjunii TaxID=3095075 RepID=A0ABU5KA25_9ACTN|nr:transporter substrate-binding domain-containing protein [Nocardioides sp. S-58]MDZ5661702.1 transporter substrate-binding domain-containing protein [Nocardioides sp. S-58]